MSQRKKLVFLSLLVCFFLVLIFPRIANLQRSNKQVEEKETQELILSEGGYTVNQDINPGLYDFLVTEGGNYNLTNMTSDEWATDSDEETGAFFMKYPTYIGGFNYEFEFK